MIRHLYVLVPSPRRRADTVNDRVEIIAERANVAGTRWRTLLASERAATERDDDATSWRRPRKTGADITNNNETGRNETGVDMQSKVVRCAEASVRQRRLRAVFCVLFVHVWLAFLDLYKRCFFVPRSLLQVQGYEARITQTFDVALASGLRSESHCPLPPSPPSTGSRWARP